MRVNSSSLKATLVIDPQIRFNKIHIACPFAFFSKCPLQLHSSTAGGCVFSRWPLLNFLTGGHLFGCLSWFPCLTLGLILVLDVVLVVGEVGCGVLITTWLPGGGTRHHIVAVTHQPSLTVGPLVLAQILLAPALNPRRELVMKL